MTWVSLPGVAAIVVAAGKGQRAGGEQPKQFALHRGKPLLRHSLEALNRCGIGRIVVAIPHGFEDDARKSAAGLDVDLMPGGETRQASVRASLAHLAADPPQNVLIHDAARPGLRKAVVARLLAALERSPGAIPVLPVADSLFSDERGVVSRDNLWRVQTPQAFRYADIFAADRSWRGPLTAGDDAEVARAAGLEVSLVEGDEALRKVTFPGDLKDALKMPRTGQGFDVHRLAAGEELWLGGIRIDHTHGLAGHSDADVALHALTDAVLGAVAAGDIGEHFPPGEPRWRGAASDRFLAHAVALADEAGYRVGHADLTIVCEAPRIGPHKSAMRGRIAEILGTGIEAVSVKATTTERLGFTGRGEGIAAQAVVTVYPIDDGEMWS